jgi:hypothetical protein
MLPPDVVDGLRRHGADDDTPHLDLAAQLDRRGVHAARSSARSVPPRARR